MSKQLWLGLSVIILLCTQSSCFLFRKGAVRIPAADTLQAVIPPSDTVSSATVATDPAREAKLRLIADLSPVLKNEPVFSTFNGKAKMRYEGKGEKHEFTTHFRIKRNEVIWASVSAMGGIVQVARIYITRDTIKLVNYLEKEVTIMPLSEASRILPAPADFTTLQNLVIGSVLRNAGTVTDAADLGAVFALQVEEPGLIQQISYNKADTTIQNVQMKGSGLGAPTGVIHLAGYTVVNGRRFAMDRTVNVVNAGEQYLLEMNFNKAGFDEPVDFPFSIPKNYKIK